MTQEPALDVTFLLGPPADPDFRASFDAAQESFGRSKDPSLAESAVLLEPRLPVLLEPTDEAPSGLDELLSALLDAPVAVRDPFVAVGRFRGAWVAIIQLQPGNLRGPAAAIGRFFADPELGVALAACLGHVLKLDWVFHCRMLGPAVAPCD